MPIRFILVNLDIRECPPYVPESGGDIGGVSSRGGGGFLFMGLDHVFEVVETRGEKI